MTARLARVALSTGAAALALGLIAPSAAFADDDDRDTRPAASQDDDRDDDDRDDDDRDDDDRDDDDKDDDDRDDDDRDDDDRDDDDKDDDDKDDDDRRVKSDDGKADDDDDDDDDDSGDPAGNNGTIKIDYAAPADSGNANRPHPGCAFQLRMFGFDDDQYGTITFVGQAPTKDVVTLAPARRLLSDDAAGGGKDVDQVYSYTAADLGLIGKPQAKQGWHVKVLVDAENAPGGAKQKVFWLDCPAAAGGASGSATTPTTSSVTESAATGGAASAASAGAATSTLTNGRVGGNSRTGAATDFTGGSAAAALGSATPAAAAKEQGGALPFTGVPMPVLLTLALGALAAGWLAIRAGRRRTSDLV